MRLALLVPVLFAATATTATTACTQLAADDDDGGGSTCSAGRVIAGNPRSRADNDPTLWNPSGHPAKADPPMRFGNIAQRGRQLVVSTARSIWRLDLDAAAPTFVRVAGDEAAPASYQPSGPCAGARFFANEGLAWLPDGRLVTGDDWANGVVELSDPLAAGCAAHAIAGTSTALTTEVTPGSVYRPADVDGPGASARFAAPNDAISDDAGNVYLWDRGNRKIKRIANDAARTVSTVFTLGDELMGVNALAFAHGALYAGGINFDGTRVIKIDPATGASMPYVNDADIAGPGASLPIAMVGAGDDLIVYASGGFLYRVAPDGSATHIAGYGGRNTNLDEAAYAGDIPAMDVPLHFLDGFVGGGNLIWDDGHLLVPSFDEGWGLWDFTCQ
ncbi:MAG: hypothetical protein IPL61_04850 [Myxococcales bacterium]|nr:hypothetical protein [Myxococcales bacterium]